ncbi:sugar ABC transporter substrate-binding protein [Vineibacter terrae]|uniref:ABC transporter substrate-binding protein n=1 Tax=Vineibacter terrae TaxID=2586908 RepID=UPI002E37AEDC|nr:sugar ABC transporter substrate-binding protein [Vineibacter terrae]HEX2889592.1 sugar ABC transporter substrate-binding protein [Vineibacter terrae]
MTLTRRTVLRTGAALAAAAGLPAPAIAQAKKISFLTWNIIDQAELINGWIARFKASRPGVDVEWLDKKGPEIPAFYQTQLTAGTPPDVINTQGALGLEYAAQGALLDLTSYLAAESAIKSRFNQDYLANWTLEGRNFMLPFYITKTLLFYNKTLFTAAGLPGAPRSFDEILDAAARITKGDDSGFLTLNFDWLYWPLFAMNGIELLSKDLKKPTFNTPVAAGVVERLAKATAAGAINKISWTGRWVEPNGAFATGKVGMLHAHSPAYFFFKGQGSWVTPDTLGVAHMPGNYATPNSHGLGISKGSKNPELAWDFLKFITADDQAGELATRRKLITGNAGVDTASLAALAKSDPLVHSVLKTQLEHTDKMVGNWRLGNDSRVKEAFWPELQNVLLGRKDAKAALADADRKVERELKRA